MRVLRFTLGIPAATDGACRAQTQSFVPAGQPVSEVVYNELRGHQSYGFWRYWIERRSTAGARLETQVETADGPISRLSLSATAFCSYGKRKSRSKPELKDS